MNEACEAVASPVLSGPWRRPNAIAPSTATPSATPTWRLVEATAAATPACDRGIVDRIVAELPDAADEPEAFCQRVGAVLEHELAALLDAGPGTPAERARRYA
ncbi:MAG: hypothetical protein ACTHJM_15195 [Marmoricola sp.]